MFHPDLTRQSHEQDVSFPWGFPFGMPGVCGGCADVAGVLSIIVGSVSSGWIAGGMGAAGWGEIVPEGLW